MRPELRRSLSLAAVLAACLTAAGLWLAAQSGPKGLPVFSHDATATGGRTPEPTTTSAEAAAHTGPTSSLPSPTPTALTLPAGEPAATATAASGAEASNETSGAATPLHFPLVLAPGPTTTPLPVNPPAGGDWRASLDYYRAAARLPALVENAAWSDGAFKHARYQVENDVNTSSEDPALAFYTSEGAAAGPNALWLVRGEANWNDVHTFDHWMRWPFHALAILDPALHSYGYGRYSEPGSDPGPFHTGAVLDVGRGLGAPQATYPVKWPDHNTAVYLTSYDGGEQPDPLTSCSGFGLNGPAGLPVLLQLGAGDVIGASTPRPVVTASSFKENGAERDHCVFDETNYQNSIASLRDQGRVLLAARDAVVVIPRLPLSPGKEYTVSVTALGQTHIWTFRVVNRP